MLGGLSEFLLLFALFVHQCFVQENEEKLWIRILTGYLTDVNINIVVLPHYLQ